jgi:hypothetical protein
MDGHTWAKTLRQTQTRHARTRTRTDTHAHADTDTDTDTHSVAHCGFGVSITACKGPTRRVVQNTFDSILELFREARISLVADKDEKGPVLWHTHTHTHSLSLSLSLSLSPLRSANQGSPFESSKRTRRTSACRLTEEHRGAPAIRAR